MSRSPIATKLEELTAVVDAEWRPASTSPAGYTQLPFGVTYADQFVIPRYANGTTFPAGGIIGQGPGRVLCGTAKTQTLTLPAVVCTEDYATVDQSQWQNGSFQQPTHLPAVLQPQCRNFTVAGHDETSSGYTLPNGIVNSQPGQWTPATTHRDKFDLMRIRGSGAVVEGVQFYYAAGTCLVVTRGHGLLNGQAGLYDKEKSYVGGCTFSRAYRGCLIEVVDAVLGENEGFALRDYGLKITGGATHINGSQHFYGIQGGSTAGTKSPAIWITASAGACWGGPLYPESSDEGLRLDNSGNRLTGVYSHTCPYGALVVGGQRNIVSGFGVQTVAGTTTKNGKAGISLAGQYHTLRDGHVDIADGETGIRIEAGGNSGNHVTIDGVTILGGNGTTATGTAIEVKDTLQRSFIRCNVQWLPQGTGVSLWDGTKSMIGAGNTILVSHDPSSVSADRAVKLPPGWSTVPRSTTNDVRINGRRYYPGADEF